jgi:hypothetical protein
VHHFLAFPFEALFSRSRTAKLLCIPWSSKLKSFRCWSRSFFFHSSSLPHLTSKPSSMQYLAAAFVLIVATQQRRVSAFQPLPSLQLQRDQFSSKASPFVAPTTLGHGLKWKVQLLQQSSAASNVEEATAALEEDSYDTSLLLDAIGYNATATTALLTHIHSGIDKGEAFLDALLANGPDASPTPFWTHSKRLARTSKRARWASLSRVLNQVTDKDKTSRGQALVMVLEALQTIAGNQSHYGALPGIVVLENKYSSGSLSFSPTTTATGPILVLDVAGVMNTETAAPAIVEAVVNDQVDENAEIPDSVTAAVVAPATEEQEVVKVRNMMWRRL